MRVHQLWQLFFQGSLRLTSPFLRQQKSEKRKRKSNVPLSHYYKIKLTLTMGQVTRGYAAAATALLLLSGASSFGELLH